MNHKTVHLFFTSSYCVESCGGTIHKSKSKHQRKREGKKERGRDRVRSAVSRTFTASATLRVRLLYVVRFDRSPSAQTSEVLCAVDLFVFLQLQPQIGSDCQSFSLVHSIGCVFPFACRLYAQQMTRIAITFPENGRRCHCMSGPLLVGCDRRSRHEPCSVVCCDVRWAEHASASV